MKTTFNAISSVIIIGLGVLFGIYDVLEWRTIFTITAIFFALMVLKDFVFVYKEQQEENDNECSNPELYFYNQYSNDMCMVVKYDRRETDPKKMYQVNYMNKEGNYVLMRWCDSGTEFNEWGCAIVAYNEKFSVIDKEGNILTKEPFAKIYTFVDGVAKVYNDNMEVNFVKPDGTLCWKYWQEEGFNQDGTIS